MATKNMVYVRTKLKFTVFFLNLIECEYEFMFSSILKHGYETGIRDINIHLELILKYIPNVKKSIYFPFLYK